MEEMNDKRLQKTYNAAVFVAFGIGFLLHAAIIFVGGIGWSHITEEHRGLLESYSDSAHLATSGGQTSVVA